MTTTDTAVAPAAVETPPPAAEVVTPVVEAAPVTPTPGAAPAAVPGIEDVAEASKKRFQAGKAQAVRANLTERMKERTAAVEAASAHPSANQPRDPAGKFAGEGKDDVKAETAAAPAAASDADGAKAATPAAGPVSIELPENHPLRAQGITKLENVPPHLELHLRALVKADTRRRDVEESKTALTAVQEENVRLKARLETLTGPDKKSLLDDPKTQQLLAQVKEHYPEQHDLIVEGLKKKDEEKVRAAEEAAVAQAGEGVEAQQFLMKVGEQAPTKYPVWLQSGELANRMRNAAVQYADYVDTRNETMAKQGRPKVRATAEEFFSWVDTNYVRDARVQQSLEQAHTARVNAEANRAAQIERQRLADAEKQRLKDAGQRHSARPPAPPAVRTQGQATDQKAVVPHGNRQRATREALRERLTAAYPKQ